MIRTTAIRQITIRRATARGLPEHIARTLADRAVRLYQRGHSAHRAIAMAGRANNGTTR